MFPVLHSSLVTQISNVTPTNPDTSFTVPTTFFFFFSSRRRHTRCYRDWSSDVCSSDLPLGPISRDLSQPLVLTAAARRERHGYPGCDGGATRSPGLARDQDYRAGGRGEIGRASCRERV